jgi:hypothetical protein
MAERRREGHAAQTYERHDAPERHDVTHHHDVAHDVVRDDAAAWVPADVYPSTINRISWDAIFAGTVVAFVAQILFTLLGLAIGLTVVEPMTAQTPWEGIGIGAGIWWVVTALISLFLGGWTAGRLSGMPLRQDAMLHGVVVWGLVTFVSVFFAVSGAGAVASGPIGMIQQAMQQMFGQIGQIDQTDLTGGVTMSAWWAFGALLAGVIAVAIGATLGAPRDLPASPGVRRE